MSTLIRNKQLFLSVPEAAMLLGVGAPTVRTWIKAGLLSAVRPGGETGHLRIPVAEVDRLAEGGRQS